MTKAEKVRQSQLRAKGSPNVVVQGEGRPLPAATRRTMEARFDASFADVRIHDDRAAAETASAMGAQAFTFGRHIAFAEGEYSKGGERLLAHELAHVRQQRGGSASLARGTFPHLGTTAPRFDEERAEHVADLAAEQVTQGRRVPAIAALSGGQSVVQRQDAKGAGKKGAPAPTNQPTKPEGPSLNIVIRAPTDKFTQDIKDYWEKTRGQRVLVVNNMEEAVKNANFAARLSGQKFKVIRLIGHGGANGGVFMTPAGEKNRRWVSPEELEKMGADQKLQAEAKDAMADDAVVEFWGCYVGSNDQTTGALGQAFQSDVKAIGSTLRTQHETFVRPPDHKDEVGETIPGRPGTWMTVVSTDEIDYRVNKGDKGLGASFDRWLIAQGAKLEADGDLPPQADNAARLQTMRDLFNRSGGKIKRALITDAGEKTTRGNKKVWDGKWKTKKLK